MNGLFRFLFDYIPRCLVYQERLVSLGFIFHDSVIIGLIKIILVIDSYIVGFINIYLWRCFIIGFELILFHYPLFIVLFIYLSLTHYRSFAIFLSLTLQLTYVRFTRFGL